MSQHRSGVEQTIFYLAMWFLAVPASAELIDILAGFEVYVYGACPYLLWVDRKEYQLEGE
jgi:hypothetical protein